MIFVPAVKAVFDIAIAAAELISAFTNHNTCSAKETNASRSGIRDMTTYFEEQIFVTIFIFEKGWMMHILSPLLHCLLASPQKLLKKLLKLPVKLLHNHLIRSTPLNIINSQRHRRPVLSGVRMR